MDFQNAPVEVRKIEGGVRICVIGSVHTNVAWLESELKKVIDSKQKLVELDLSQNDFLSSTGIGLIVYLHNSVKAYGGRMVIVSIQPAVFKTLRYARLDTVIEMLPDAVVEDAKPSK